MSTRGWSGCLQWDRRTKTFTKVPARVHDSVFHPLPMKPAAHNEDWRAWVETAMETSSPRWWDSPMDFLEWVDTTFERWSRLVSVQAKGPHGHVRVPVDQQLAQWVRYRERVQRLSGEIKCHPRQCVLPLLTRWSKWMTTSIWSDAGRCHRELVVDELLTLATTQMRWGWILEARQSLGLCFQLLREQSAHLPRTQMQQEPQFTTAKSLLLACVAWQSRVQVCETALGRAQCPVQVQREILNELSLLSVCCDGRDVDDGATIERILHLRVKIMMQLGRSDRVVDELNECRFTQYDGELTKWLGTALQAQGFLQEAVQAYDSFLRYVNGSPQLCIGGRQVVEAVQASRDRLKHVVEYVQDGDRCMDTDRFDKAIDAYTESWRLAGFTHVSANWRAHLLLRRANAHIAKGINGYAAAKDDLHQSLSLKVANEPLIRMKIRTLELEEERLKLVKTHSRAF